MGRWWSEKTIHNEGIKYKCNLLLVRHAEDGKKYLYDLLAIKKETSSPLE